MRERDRWESAEGGRIVCEVRDEGFIDDDLVGRLRPAITEEQDEGFGSLIRWRIYCTLRSAPQAQWRIIFDCASPR